ncbi:hypothetical protein QBC43DRAFT_294920 [Cladorrhinum sp. PSN259]|nr:hypothetical protein QBC43DRAFT_294920 [Cladorrhinum sp. PSN259]
MGLFIEDDLISDASKVDFTPKTPSRRTRNGIIMEFKTPQKSLDIRKHQQLLKKRLDCVDKVLFKAGKSIDQKSAEIALLRAENFRLKEELHSYIAPEKKTVEKDANSLFENIEFIKQAQVEREAAIARDRALLLARSKDPDALAAETSRQLQKIEYKDMCGRFQV